MIQLLSNAFNDPSDPWYYVIGVLFLLLIFGAVAVYVIFSGKRKNKQENADEPEKPETADKDIVTASEEPTESSDADRPQQKDEE
ncbi:MAG: hypothetical protein J1F69_04160 [Clostridiales bacterium]|nr:hypothetical protein [Clostridiales bacterium]